MRTLVAVISLALFGLGACGELASEELEDQGIKIDGKEDASADAVFLSFEFDGEILVSYVSSNTNKQIQDHLLYTIGHLNAEDSVGRLDKLETSGIETVEDGDNTRLKFHAKLPVAWGRTSSVPTTYELKLPKDNTYQGLEAFTKKYMHDCVGGGAHDVDSGSMWYYYRPSAYSCELDPADIYTTTATVKPTGTMTTGKFPEYHKVWEDNALKIVAVFGKYEDYATSDGDSGISAYNEFVRRTRSLLAPHKPTTTPDQVSDAPGVKVPDVTFKAELGAGKNIEVVALLVDNVRSGGAAFDARYHDLSTRADLIAYSGHSGLGANVKALASKGKWVAGQYVMVFMNGCDSYTYIDSALNVSHAAVNPEDPNGTKHVDIITNAMPSYFSSMADSTLDLVEALLAFDAPKTYEQIFAAASDRSRVTLVSGEEDNEFVPGGGGGTPVEEWTGLAEEGTVKKSDELRFETPRLEAGSYLFSMTGTADADLYARIGTAPTTKLYDCRPYRSGSKESCVVELPAAAPIHVMVRGWAASSSFKLVGSRKP
jgi:hypothetical protein